MPIKEIIDKILNDMWERPFARNWECEERNMRKILTRHFQPIEDKVGEKKHICWSLQEHSETCDICWKRYSETQVQEAIEIIIKEQKATATLLQRKMWISFAVWADIMDELEKRWIVWPQIWARPRKIFTHIT